MELPTIRAIDLIRLLPASVPPALLLSSLLGVIAAASFFLVAGRGFRSLPTYLLLGLMLAPIGQSLSHGLPRLPTPMIGEVDVVFVLAATWTVLALARGMRL